jgi:hypothetical protein
VACLGMWIVPTGLLLMGHGVVGTVRRLRWRLRALLLGPEGGSCGRLLHDDRAEVV